MRLKKIIVAPVRRKLLWFWWRSVSHKVICSYLSNFTFILFYLTFSDFFFFFVQFIFDCIIYSVKCLLYLPNKQLHQQQQQKTKILPYELTAFINVFFLSWFWIYKYGLNDWQNVRQCLKIGLKIKQSDPFVQTHLKWKWLQCKIK